jgi:undecaprenyl-diphosphatase
MSAADELKIESGKLIVGLRRCAMNVVAGVAVLLRGARFNLRAAWPLTPQRLAIAAAVAIAVFGLGMVFIDASAITAARQLPRWLISAFDWYTDFGKSGWFLWPLGILYLALAAMPRALSSISRGVTAAIMVRVGFLFVAVGLPSVFSTIVKNMIGRARPFVGGAANPYLFDPFHWTPAYASLPSGHATTAFAVLAAFGTLWPRARTILLLYALLIAVSRVVVTAHHPTDVLAGALVGYAGALLVRRHFALRGLGFTLGADGILHQKPGPSFRRIKSIARELLA